MRVDPGEALEVLGVARDQLADVVVVDAPPLRTGALPLDHREVDARLVHLLDEELDRALLVRLALAAVDRERVELDRVLDCRPLAVEVDAEVALERRLDAEIDDHQTKSISLTISRWQRLVCARKSAAAGRSWRE